MVQDGLDAVVAGTRYILVDREAQRKMNGGTHWLSPLYSF